MNTLSLVFRYLRKVLFFILFCCTFIGLTEIWILLDVGFSLPYLITLLAIKNLETVWFLFASIASIAVCSGGLLGMILAKQLDTSHQNKLLLYSILVSSTICLNWMFGFVLIVIGILLFRSHRKNTDLMHNILDAE